MVCKYASAAGQTVACAGAFFLSLYRTRMEHEAYCPHAATMLAKVTRARLASVGHFHYQQKFVDGC